MAWMESSGRISADQPPLGLSPNSGAATIERILIAGSAPRSSFRRTFYFPAIVGLRLQIRTRGVCRNRPGRSGLPSPLCCESATSPCQYHSNWLTALERPSLPVVVSHLSSTTYRVSFREYCSVVRAVTRPPPVLSGCCAVVRVCKPSFCVNPYLCFVAGQSGGVASIACHGVSRTSRSPGWSVASVCAALDAATRLDHLRFGDTSPCRGTTSVSIHSRNCGRKA